MIKKIIILLLPLICFIPNKVSAAALSVNATKTNLLPNTETTLNVNLTGLPSTLGKIAISIKYDSNKMTLINTKALQGTLSSNSGAGLLNVIIEGNDLNNGGLLQLVMKSTANAIEGTSMLTFTINESLNNNLTAQVPITGSTSLINHTQATNDNSLKFLNVSNCQISPSFIPTVTSYSCNTKDNSVIISALANDANSIISGAGEKKLNSGSNIYPIIVTNQLGQSKTYIINITKNDENDNTNLSSLSIQGFNLNFNPNIYNYSLNVPNETSAVNILATAKEESTTITGIGVHNLKEGINSIVISVKDINNNFKTYSISINRLSKENKPSTKLNKLMFNNQEIILTDKKIYLIGVDNSIKKINFELTPESITAKTEINGNDNLKTGINIIDIIVKDEGLEDDIYKIVVNKNAKSVVTNLDNIDQITENIVYESSEESTISKKIFELLKDKSNTFTYNYVNKNKGLLYSLEFNQNVFYEEDYTISLIKTNNYPLTYVSNVPAGVNMKIFIDPEVTTINNFYLYSYNQSNNEYTLINSNLNIEDYYISFISSGENFYILSDSLIEKQTVILTPQKKTNWFSYVLCILIGIIIGVFGYSFKPKLFPKKPKVKIINREIEKL